MAVVNQFNAAQRNGLEKSFEVRSNTFEDDFDRRSAESEARMEKCFAELKILIARYHSSQVRWLFAYFFGIVVTFVTFLSIFHALLK